MQKPLNDPNPRRSIRGADLFGAIMAAALKRFPVGSVPRYRQHQFMSGIKTITMRTIVTRTELQELLGLERGFIDTWLAESPPVPPIPHIPGIGKGMLFHLPGVEKWLLDHFQIGGALSSDQTATAMDAVPLPRNPPVRSKTKRRPLVKTSNRTAGRKT